MYMDKAKKTSAQVYNKSSEYATKGFNESSKIGSQIGDGAGNVVNEIRDGAGNVVNKIRDGAGNVVNEIRDGAGNVINEIRDSKVLNYLIPIITVFISLSIMILFFGSKYLPLSIEEYGSAFWAFKKLPKHFFIFIVSTSFAFLLSLLPYNKKIRESVNTWKVFYIISSLIFLGTFTLIGICTSFVEVFENTIGVSFLDKEKLNDVFDNFKPKVFEEAKIDLTYLVRLFNVKNFTYYFDNFMKTAILNETIEKSTFIDLKYEHVNEYDEKVKKKPNQVVNEVVNDETKAFLAAFKDVVDKGLKDAQPASKSLYESHYIVSGEEDKYKIGELRQNLFNICLKKFTTGHLTWMYFASLISILASMSQIV